MVVDYLVTEFKMRWWQALLTGAGIIIFAAWAPFAVVALHDKAMEHYWYAFPLIVSMLGISVLLIIFGIFLMRAGWSAISTQAIIASQERLTGDYEEV